MSYGPGRVFACTMTSGANLSNAVDLGRAWSIVYLEIPSMTSNSQINIQASNTLDGTYRRMRHPSINTSSVQTQTFSIQSATTSAFVQILAGPRYLKVETTATCDSGEVFRFICSS